MTRYYVFNGDADGLCALQQLRLAERASGDNLRATLVTGVKRDIELLGRVPVPTDDSQHLDVTVLDISLDKNREPLLRLLAAGARVRYFDHHQAGQVPEHPDLEAHIDLSPTVCTSLLVDRSLDGRYRSWAIAAAFGDNLGAEARTFAQALGLGPPSTDALEALGVALNYNAYGETLADLHVPPAELAEEMLPYEDPLGFAQSSASYLRLAEGYREDMGKARSLEPTHEEPESVLFVLPAEPWARRASGVLANELTEKHPKRAIAIVSPKSSGGYLVSVRVPKGSILAADAFCGQFRTGGGRRTAAGINDLPEGDIEGFRREFARQFRAQ